MRSQITHLGQVEFPEYTGLRIMMMPFLLHDITTVPPNYESTIERILSALVNAQPHQSWFYTARGTGYLTIDEAVVLAGETHRRPGKHVDGCGIWGGGSPWAKNGMVVAANVVGCHGWNQVFDGEPGTDGDCEHLANQCCEPIVMEANQAYWCSRYAVHESIVFDKPTRRQWLRVSMPSAEPWYEGYTESAHGVMPTGPILPRRVEQMGYRA